MHGGLGASTRLINTNGKCLINASINSIMNSHEIMKHLYYLTDPSISINQPFSEIILDDEKDVLIQLLSAYTHDFVNNVSNPDLDKILFVVKNLATIESITDIQKLRKYLDNNYKTFSHSKLIKTDLFLGLCLYEYVTIDSIGLRSVKRLQKDLERRLRNNADVYFLITIPDDIDTISDLTDDDLKCIKLLYKIVMTSTDRYICTDIICYEGDEDGFDHVIYYNMLDSTFTDDDMKEKRQLRSLHNDSSYIYIPCLLHFQKLHSEDLKLDGTFKRYEELYENRIQFIREQISGYTEPWIKAHVEKYLKELAS